MEEIYLTVLLLPGILFSANAGKFRVTGPNDTVVAIVGEDVIVECKLVPDVSIQSMTVRWLKSDLDFAVHMFRNGKDETAVQDPGYRGRTELFKDQMANGDASLRINTIRVSDEGKYICSVDDGIDFEETPINLKVGGLGHEHWIYIGGYQKDGIQLVCESSGWYPEPAIQWMRGDKQNLTSKSEVNYQQDSEGLVNAQSKISVPKDSTNRFRCILQNRVLKKEQEATIEIADVFFPVVSGWLVFLCLILCLLLIALTLGILWNIKRRKLKKDLGNDKSVKQFGQWKPLVESDWKIMCKSKVVVKLDTETAHPRLEVSKDLQFVKLTPSNKSLPKNEERFTAWECVLGSEGFTLGKHYWEVEVGRNHHWSLGIAAESVNRAGDIELDPKKGFWTIGQDEKKIHANLGEKSNILYHEIPSKIGIYLEYDSGIVSFFVASTKAFLYTFTEEKFNEKLYPFFHTTHNNQGLRICPVEELPTKDSQNVPI